jgi:hypothetical protein
VGRWGSRLVRLVGVVGVVLVTLAFTMLPGQTSAATCPPSVSLSAAQTVVDASAPNTTLTVSLTSALCAPYYVSVYDDLGNRLSYMGAGGPSSYSVTVTPGNNKTRTYTAYVSLDVPTQGPPSSIASSSSSVTVTNVGWDGTVTLAADHTQVDANSPNATLTVTLSKPIVSPYYVSVYDDLGNRISYMGPGGPSSFSVTVTPGNNKTRTYTAEVS